MPVIVSILLLAASSLSVQADATTPCRTEVALEMLERATQARDDFFFWEDLDEHEASAELQRYVSRLERLKHFVTDCAPREPGIAALQWQVQSSLSHAYDIALARQSAANREARSR